MKLDVSFLNGQARTARPWASYANDPQGWSALKTAIVAGASLLGSRTRIVCGMESTANMHKRLEQALRAETRRKIEVHVLNPRTVKHFAKALLKDAKTDRLDSQLIARFLVSMRPQPDFVFPDQFEELKESTRTRRRLVEERTDHKNRLHKLLRYHFPGYRRRLGIRQLPMRLLVLLADRPSPHLLLEPSPRELARTRYATRHRVGLGFAEKLHALAVQAPRLQLPKVTCMLIAAEARRILELNALLTEVDRAIDELLQTLYPNQTLTSIPGLGQVSAAAIIAEVGDVARFQTKTHFVGYCGLYPIVRESGTFKKREFMTYKGNRMLKMTLLIASAAARQYNPILASFMSACEPAAKPPRPLAARLPASWLSWSSRC